MPGVVVKGGAPTPILHVLHHLVTGGMENGLVNLINHLPDTRWGHRVLCIEDFSDFRLRIQRQDVEVLGLHRSRIGTWALRRRVYDTCREYGPALVHTRNLSGLDALPPAWLAGGNARVHSEHGWDVDNLDGSKRRPAWLRRVHSVFVDRYVTVSQDLQRYLSGTVGIASNRIVQIYNGVDTERFAPRQGQRSALLPPGFDQPDALLFGTVGRLQRVKDQRTLLQAAALLLRDRPDLLARLKLVVVGGGPMLDALQTEAQALGLSERTWFAGSLDSVAALLPSLDVFVLPSLMEGTSNTLLEAMACALPVLATAVGGNRELVRDGEVGHLFAPGDAPRLASLMTGYADDRSRRQADGARARQLVLDNFSLKAMVRQYDALYSSVLRPTAGQVTRPHRN